MQSQRLSAVLALSCLAALIVAGGAEAGGARVRVDGLILHADGGFQPRTLPRRRYVPIDFQGYFDVRAEGGGSPAPLEQVVVDFDRDGRLSAGGLPTCPAELVASASPEEARRICRGAIVGTGTIEASIDLGGVAVPARSPLTIFNGPREDGHPTVVIHAQTTVPGTQTFAIPVPIERLRGEFRYRATLNLPPIAGGLGAVTRVSVDIGRRFRAGGHKRSYVSARCTDGILRTRGRFTFANPERTIIFGSVEKPCTPE